MAVRPTFHRFALLLAALFALAATVPISAPAQGAAPALQTCFNIVINGGFETNDGWQLGGGLLPPQYVNWPVKSGVRAMQAGNVGQPNQNAYSNFSQTLSIPVDAISAQLTFWILTQSGPNPVADRQEVLLLTPGANVETQSSGAIWIAPQPNSGVYQQVTLSLNSQIGRIFDLTFSVYNDGTGDSSAMFVDDVTLTICQAAATPTPLPSATPMPSATPLPTAVPVPSPIPPNCVDILANGGFEWDGAWQLGGTPLTPFYAGPPNPVQSGNRSMALGAALPSAPSVESFSSVQQAITIPATSQTAQIRFWYYPISNATAGGFNRQELVLLDPLNYQETIAVPWRVTENANNWIFNEIDLTRYRGRTLSVYFNARNAGDGTRTAMFLDQVQVLVCEPVVIMPLAQPAIVEPTEQPAVLVVPPAVSSPTPLAEPTRLSVVSQPGGAPIPAAAAEMVATPQPERRSNQESWLAGLLDSPWSILLAISGIFLLAVVLALIFFRGDRNSSRQDS